MSNMFMRQHWLVKIILIVVALWVLANLVLLSSASADTYQTNLDNATVVESTDSTMLLTAPPASLLQGSIPAGCHGLVWRKSSIVIRYTHIVIGWRRTMIDRWCNSTRGQIYDWGAATGDYGKWATSPYCWYDATYGKVWWTVSKSEAKVWNQGTLKVCGRISLGKTVNPRIYFHSATATRRYRYWNYGNLLHIYH
jgi:hypothetical protein